MKSPIETLTSLYELAIFKASLPYHKRAVAAWLGGAYLSFGGILALTFASNFAAEMMTSMGTLIYAFIFPVGLLLIVLTKVDLFTSNCMVVTVGVWYDFKTLTFGPKNSRSMSIIGILNTLVNSWIWNLIGSLCMAYFLCIKGDLINDRVGVSLIAMAKRKFALTPSACFIRAISANWLVCLAVFLAYSNEDNTVAKIVSIWFPIMAFVGIGLEHSVANMFTLPLAVMYNTIAPTDIASNQVTWTAWGNNILLVTLGNILGGMFTALVYCIINSAGHSNLLVKMEDDDSNHSSQDPLNSASSCIISPIHHEKNNN